MSPSTSDEVRHRGIYILERGVWRVTCRACGWRTGAPERRQAASRFRLHIMESRIVELGRSAREQAASPTAG